jgi:propionyl-CoA carboxylase alpha chain
LKKPESAFIGPNANAMRIMGSKLAAKECVKKYNIPMVPGIQQAITDIQLAKDIAKQVGYPVLIKASAGWRRQGYEDR